MTWEEILVEDDSEFLICWPIFRRFEHQNISLGPVPSAVQGRLKSHPLHRCLLQVFKARSGFAETNYQPRELQLLLQLGDLDWNDRGRNSFGFRQVRIPLPSPRSAEGNQKDRK